MFAFVALVYVFVSFYLLSYCIFCCFSSIVRRAIRVFRIFMLQISSRVHGK